jgi:PKD repeat protein
MTTVPCNPFAVQFGYTSDRPIVAWNWDFGDNTTSTDSTPVHVFAAGDTFSVRLIATGECGNSQHVRTNYVKLKPRPIVTAFATPGFACVGVTEVAFTANVTGAISSSLWIFGDGVTASGTSVAHTYTQVGKYLPKIVIVSTCGQDTIAVSDSIVVGSLPIAAAAASADSGYEQLSVQFTDQTTNLPTSWSWRFGDTQQSTLQNPTHLYTTGLYQSSLIASNQCGADTSTNRRIVVGSYRSVIVDSLGSSDDTILYSVRVDTLVIGYDHPVYLSGQVTPFPVQGSVGFVFEPSAGVPPFTATMKVIPSLNLASGNYSLEMRAVDSVRLNQQGLPLTKIATRGYAHVGFTAIEVIPNPIAMDSTIVSQLSTRTITIRNTSTMLEPYTLIIQPAQTSGPPFQTLPNQGNGATLGPGQSKDWVVGFAPTRKGDVSGWVRVISNDPGNPTLQVTMTGRGLGEQVPPRVTVASPLSNAEATIDQGVSLTFSEQMVIVPLDTVLRVTSRRTGAPILGTAVFNQLAMSFMPDEWMWPDDTVTLTLRAIVTDTNGNRLDGNSDGNEGGSPSDDFVLTFFTGPGVYPGDANRDGVVNEADILPIGRFWRIQGPPRSQPYTDLSMQPARAFPIRAAAHADCDGNGIVDSADVCPIAEFFDQDTVLPKAVVELWLEEAQAWNATVVDAMLGALLDCPSQGAGTAVLRQALSEMQNQNPIPLDYALEQNYPNPFNPATVIAYTLSLPGEVRLDVFDILGRRLTTLADGVRDAGVHRVIWDGRDEGGASVASGIYFYRLSTKKFTQTRKMLLLK